MKKIVSPVCRLTAILVAASVLVMCEAQAQTYTPIELAPNLLFSAANSIAAGVAAGYTATTATSITARATLWNGSGQIDLHPSFLDDAITGSNGRSAVQGGTDMLQVGWGVGADSNNRSVPMAWNGTADSAYTLELPFTNFGGQALATDGSQIVGYGTTLNKDGTAIGSTHAAVWDVTTAQGIDLGDGGNGAKALGVGGGQQVGYVIKSQSNAAIWYGSANSLTVIHPKNAVTSVANGTDGVLQVGYSGYDVRVRAEAAKGNKNKRFTYATVWAGTAQSAQIIHPYPFTHSYAIAVKGKWIVGYAGDESKTGTPGFYHAIAWDENFQPTDLNAFLPAKFVGSQAFSVDDQGNIAGIALSADGQRHALVWQLDAAQ